MSAATRHFEVTVTATVIFDAPMTMSQAAQAAMDKLGIRRGAHITITDIHVHSEGLGAAVHLAGTRTGEEDQ
jgi:hypothetical protein